ncbi:hypothetical protein SEA_JUSTBECAUSE_319 [Streptomyces phage JustBecause]|nr:hypothetical protein SEA_JUSTBECAUSE_319 [Streptomyces phage JustBecause]
MIGYVIAGLVLVGGAVTLRHQWKAVRRSAREAREAYRRTFGA